MKLELTEEQANQLAQLIDAAIRASGAQAAIIAVPLLQLMQAAAQEQTKEPEANG